MSKGIALGYIPQGWYIPQSEFSLLILITEGDLDFGVIWSSVADPSREWISVLVAWSRALYRLQNLTFDCLVANILKNDCS